MTKPSTSQLSGTRTWNGNWRSVLVMGHSIAIAWLGVALGIVAPIAVAASNYVVPPWLPNPWIIAICVVLAAVIWGVVAAAVLRPVRIDPNVAWFNGAGESFLSSLEPAPSTTPTTIPGAARIG